jgi:hypothetical protein
MNIQTADSGVMRRPQAHVISGPVVPLPDASAAFRRWTTLRLTSPQSASVTRATRRDTSRPPTIRLSDDQIAALARTAMPLLPMFLAASGVRLWLRAKEAREDRGAARDLIDGWIVLAAMPPDSSYVDAAAIAAETGITSRRVIRLLYTLALLRLVEFDPDTDRYRVRRWPQ